jgi:glutathione S-transferase
MGHKSYWANLQEINSLLEGKDWMMGKQYTVVDPYALVFYGWGVRSEFPMKELAAFTAWKDRMLKRPAVMKILQSEQNVLVKAA